MSNSIKEYDEKILKIIKQDKISLYSIIDKLNILSSNKREMIDYINKKKQLITVINLHYPEKKKLIENVIVLLFTKNNTFYKPDNFIHELLEKLNYSPIKIITEQLYNNDATLTNLIDTLNIFKKYEYLRKYIYEDVKISFLSILYERYKKHTDYINKLLVEMIQYSKDDEFKKLFAIENFKKAGFGPYSFWKTKLYSLIQIKEILAFSLEEILITIDDTAEIIKNFTIWI